LTEALNLTERITNRRRSEDAMRLRSSLSVVIRYPKNNDAMHAIIKPKKMNGDNLGLGSRNSYT
jgi:hypothetical protein